MADSAYLTDETIFLEWHTENHYGQLDNPKYQPCKDRDGIVKSVKEWNELGIYPGFDKYCNCAFWVVIEDG